jgi:hypothetical protein
MSLRVAVTVRLADRHSASLLSWLAYPNQKPGAVASLRLREIGPRPLRDPVLCQLCAQYLHRESLKQLPGSDQLPAPALVERRGVLGASVGAERSLLESSHLCDAGDGRMAPRWNCRIPRRLPIMRRPMTIGPVQAFVIGFPDNDLGIGGDKGASAGAELGASVDTGAPSAAELVTTRLVAERPDGSSALVLAIGHLLGGTAARCYPRRPDASCSRSLSAADIPHSQQQTTNLITIKEAP